MILFFYFYYYYYYFWKPDFSAAGSDPHETRKEPRHGTE